MQRIRPSSDLKNLTLLYVEDEDSIREPFLMLIERYLKKVYVATNGEEGLELFKKYHNEIDLIISDIRMPKMTGLEMAKYIKEINFEIPLIFVTAFGDTEYLQSAIEVGADGYLVKPIDRNKLFNKLNFLGSMLVSKKQNIEYAKLIKTLFDYQTNGVLLLDKDLNIKIYNKTFKNMLDSINIEKPSDLNDILEFCFDKNNNKLDIDRFLSNEKLVCYHKNDVIKYYDIDIKKIETYILVTFNDITEYELTQEKIYEESIKDELTGLYNRKRLLSITNEKVCIILFDIDDFKQINDTYGHLKGDEVLKTLAKTILENVRNSDIVIRWGGEEFIIILENNDINIAFNLAEKLRSKIDQITIDEVGHFSCSFGVSCGIVYQNSDIQNIIKNADQALYKAKRNGKNRVEVY